MIAIAIGGEAAGLQVEPRLARSDAGQHRRRRDGAQHLGHDIGQDVPGGKRLPASNPTVTAGLKCPPEIWPTAKAMVSTVRPNARATPA